MRVVKEKAYAKINLYLDVIAKRSDGFHDIKTVMHSISLYDVVTVSYAPSAVTNVRMSIAGTRFLPTDDKNLAVRAAKSFLNKAGKTANIDIKLEKRIPISAGLAGGSSDAAATLRALNKLFDKVFSEKVLFKIAAELGSDVPYCLYAKTALCEGRGEILTKLPDNLKLNVVVAISNERVSTPMAYGKLDALYSDFDGTKSADSAGYYSRLISSVNEGKLDSGSLFNIFEDAVLPDCKGATYIKKRFIELGACDALMSGSGPSVFAIFADEKTALEAIEAFKKENIRAYYAESV